MKALELLSGKEREPKPKLFGPDIFGGGSLPREGVGAKKFSMSFETQGNQTFWRDIPGFCRDIPEWPERFEKKKFVFNTRPPYITEIVLELFLGAVILIGDLSDFRDVIAGKLGLWEN